jgi:uncharacterized damage-inducible protein DinB
MKHDAIVEQWAYFRKVVGVTRQMIEQIPETDLDFKPTPNVRSAKEIVVHTYGMIPDAVHMVATGQYVERPQPDIKTKAQLLKWADEQVETGFSAFDKLTAEHTGATLVLGGQDYPAWQILDFTFQEHLHHRGQLTVYLRMLGLVPASIYGE